MDLFLEKELQKKEQQVPYLHVVPLPLTPSTDSCNINILHCCMLHLYN